MFKYSERTPRKQASWRPLGNDDQSNLGAPPPNKEDEPAPEEGPPQQRERRRRNNGLKRSELTVEHMAGTIESLRKDVRSLVPPLPKTVEEIVSYGLGSPSQSTNARWQLAFLLELAAADSARPRPRVILYDPAFNELDLRLFSIKTLGCTVLSVNESCKRTVEVSTLFFMPHCGRALYNNVLWANWDRLERILVVGNGFTDFCDDLSPAKQKQTFECLRQCCDAGWVAEKPLVVDQGHPARLALHSTSIHSFSAPVTPRPPEPLLDQADGELVQLLTNLTVYS